MNKKGFTLTEVMIVFIILGIIAAIAVPPFVAHKEKEEKATRTFLEQIQTKTEEETELFSKHVIKWRANTKYKITIIDKNGTKTVKTFYITEETE